MTFISEQMNKAQERGLCVSHHVASAQILSCSSDKEKDIIKWKESRTTVYKLYVKILNI